MQDLQPIGLVSAYAFDIPRAHHTDDDPFDTSTLLDSMARREVQHCPFWVHSWNLMTSTALCNNMKMVAVLRPGIIIRPAKLKRQMSCRVCLKRALVVRWRINRSRMPTDKTDISTISPKIVSQITEEATYSRTNHQPSVIYVRHYLFLKGNYQVT